MSSPSGATTAALPDQSLVDDPMYTVDQVATVLQRSRASVWKLLAECDRDGNPVLVSVTVGVSRRVRRSDLEAYIAGLVPSVPARTTRGATSS